MDDIQRIDPRQDPFVDRLVGTLQMGAGIQGGLLLGATAVAVYVMQGRTVRGDFPDLIGLLTGSLEWLFVPAALLWFGCETLVLLVLTFRRAPALTRPSEIGALGMLVLGGRLLAVPGSLFLMLFSPLVGLSFAFALGLGGLFVHRGTWGLRTYLQASAEG